MQEVEIIIFTIKIAKLYDDFICNESHYVPERGFSFLVQSQLSLNLPLFELLVHRTWQRDCQCLWSICVVNRSECGIALYSDLH